MKDGFSKISIKPQKKSIPVIEKKKTKMPKKFVVIITCILIFLAALIGATFVLGKDFYYSIKTTEVDAKAVSAAIKTQNIEEAQSKLKNLKNSLSVSQAKYDKLSYLKLLPIVRNYWLDGYHILKAASYGIDAGDLATTALVPYSDLLGLKGKGTFVGGSADQRIQTAVKTLDKVTPKISDISGKIELVKKELDQVDPNRYPEKIGKTVIRSRLIAYRGLFDESANLFINAKPLLEQLPKLFGEPEAKRYLIIFQNDKELRATGGFITGYAIFKIEHGKLNVERADDIYKLDEAKSKTFPAPKEILTYHKNVFTFEIRDSNISPDFTESMKTFETMLSTVNGFPKYDGIIAIDTHVLVESMKILGSIPAYGTNFTAENDKRCDCPNVIYELELYADKPVAYERGSRKDIIGVLLYQIMQKALGVSPSQYWGKLFQMALDEMEQKHILFALNDAKAQSGIEALNFAGRIKSFGGNYLHINDVNFGGAKSNMFVKEYVTYNLDTDKDNNGIVTITIDYKNPAPASDCGLESGGLCLNGQLRNWVRIYTPKGSQVLDFKGSKKDTKTYDDLGKTVIEGFLTVDPKQKSQIIVKYKLPDKIDKNKVMPLLIQKQPGTENNEYIIQVNGRQVNKFNLLKDLETTIKL